MKRALKFLCFLIVAYCVVNSWTTVVAAFNAALGLLTLSTISISSVLSYLTLRRQNETVELISKSHKVLAENQALILKRIERVASELKHLKSRNS